MANANVQAWRLQITMADIDVSYMRHERRSRPPKPMVQPDLFRCTFFFLIYCFHRLPCRGHHVLILSSSIVSQREPLMAISGSCFTTGTIAPLLEGFVLDRVIRNDARSVWLPRVFPKPSLYPTSPSAKWFRCEESSIVTFDRAKARLCSACLEAYVWSGSAIVIRDDRCGENGTIDGRFR
jgi:hypothetical protein